MRTCPACSFENMDGSRLCGRCGAKLVWDGPTDRDSFAPPRAGWNKRLYPAAYFLGVRAPILRRQVTTLRRLPPRRVLAVALSALPGLGHLYLGDRGAAAKIAVAWFGPLFWTVHLYNAYPRIFQYTAPFFWVLLMLIHTFTVVSAANPGLYGKSTPEVRMIWISLLIMVGGLYLIAGYVIQSFLPLGLEAGGLF